MIQSFQCGGCSCTSTGESHRPNGSCDLAEAVVKMQALAARPPAITLHNIYGREYNHALQDAREDQTFPIAATSLAWPRPRAFAAAVEAMRGWQPTIPHMRKRVPEDRGLAVSEEYSQEYRETRGTSRIQS